MDSFKCAIILVGSLLLTLGGYEHHMSGQGLVGLPLILVAIIGFSEVLRWLKTENRTERKGETRSDTTDDTA